MLSTFGTKNSGLVFPGNILVIFLFNLIQIIYKNKFQISFFKILLKKADFAGGGTYAVLGILIALFER